MREVRAVVQVEVVGIADLNTNVHEERRLREPQVREQSLLFGLFPKTVLLRPVKGPDPSSEKRRRSTKPDNEALDKRATSGKTALFGRAQPQTTKIP